MSIHSNFRIPDETSRPDGVRRRVNALKDYWLLVCNLCYMYLMVVWVIRERVSCSDHKLEGGLGLCWGFQLGDSPPALVKGWQHVQIWVDTL